MTEDAGRAGTSRRARRPGPVAVGALAVALLFGGGAAVAVGLTGRDAVPPPLAADPVSAPPPGTRPPSDPEAARATPSTVPEPSAARAAADRGAAAVEDESANEAAEPAAVPVQLSIPAIDVSSDLLHLGLADDGRLEVPQGPDFDTAAWFDGSPRPGDVGPAVLLGHVSSAALGPSVFFDLTRLQVGDSVAVTRADGTVATFEVYDLQQFPKDAFPTAQVYGPTSGPELRLITCGGTIAESTGRFSDNIIVFARES
jgi:sortase (surface protein transpeptidase)